MPLRLLDLLPSTLAYTDPGSGAMLWQVMSAAVVGGLFYFRRAVAWFRGGNRSEKK